MLIPVVLSGGAGTRLWPVSRKAYPKPFMRLAGGSLLEHAISRGQSCGAAEVMIVTNQEQLLVTKQLIAELTQKQDIKYLVEPDVRNTAPAITLAALMIEQTHGREATMLTLPADHLIPDISEFVSDVMKAVSEAARGRLVVFGIRPTHVETGYGYIQVASNSAVLQDVLKFVEKPDLVTAQEYIDKGNFYWNSGMFCFTAGAFLDAMKIHAPDVLYASKETMATAQTQPGEVRFNPHAFSMQPNISIDYALMERADNVTLVPAKFRWNDVGSWKAVADASTPDSNGNTFVTETNVDWISVDTENTHVHIDSHGHKRVVATVGIKDVIVVHTPDALLIGNKTRAQDVRLVVDALRQRHIGSGQHQSTLLPSSVNRPWGAYTTVTEEDGYKVKRISVRVGQSLSLQYHHKRAEHWVVVRGSGVVQIGSVEYSVNAGTYKFIPREELHRLVNTGTEELVLIEIQLGEYLGEDDIVRLADIYGRV